MIWSYFLYLKHFYIFEANSTITFDSLLYNSNYSSILFSFYNSRWNSFPCLLNSISCFINYLFFYFCSYNYFFLFLYLPKSFSYKMFCLTSSLFVALSSNSSSFVDWSYSSSIFILFLWFSNTFPSWLFVRCFFSNYSFDFFNFITSSTNSLIFFILVSKPKCSSSSYLLVRTNFRTF